MQFGFKNIAMTPQEMALIRALNDFDSIMLLSEVSDYGWTHGRELLRSMRKYQERQRKLEREFEKAEQ